MPTSTQITNELNKKHDPIAAEYALWKKTRYLVAQQPASPDYRETKIGYFEGRVVIPGPKYNPKLSDGLEFETPTINDFQIMKNRHFIRFVDNRTTPDAGEDVSRALYTVMSPSEADAYEKALSKQQGKNNGNKSKGVSG